MHVKRAMLPALALFTLMNGLVAHEGHQGAATRIVGEVIDTVCYVSHASRGPDHLDCARDCAAKGISLGILEEKTGRVYISLPVDHSNPNAKLMDYIARRVEVQGEVFRKGGLTGVFVKSVKELQATPPSAEAKK